MKFVKSSKQIARRAIIKTANLFDIPGKRLSKINRDIILAYHSVESQQSCYPYAVNKDNFEQHIYFVKENVEVVSLDKMFNSVNNSFRVAITFDDAYEDFYTNVYPVLQRTNTPASVFVPTSFISTEKKILEQDERGYCKSHLSWGQMNEMQSEMIRFESHSHSHISAITQSEVKFRNDLDQSIHLLEKNLGRRPKYFSYPGGAHNSTTDEISLGCGFQRILGLDNVNVTEKKCERRVSILKENEDINFFKCKVAGFTNYLNKISIFLK